MPATPPPIGFDGPVTPESALADALRDAGLDTGGSGGGGTTSTVLGNLGAAHTFTNTAVPTDPHFQGTLDQNATLTISVVEGAHLELAVQQDGVGGHTVAFAGVDTWKTSTNAAPTALVTSAGSTEFFYFEKINGTTYGWWLTEPPSGGTADALYYKAMPTGAVAETHSRTSRSDNNQTVIISGRMSLTLIRIPKGKVVSNITFVSGSTAATAPTHQWFCIYDKNRNKLAVTVDDGATAWAANTPKTLALSAPWTCPADDYYYVGVVVVATTVPNFSGATLALGLSGIAPVIASSTDSGLTDPASAPAICATLTNPLQAVAYAYLA